MSMINSRRKKLKSTDEKEMKKIQFMHKLSKSDELKLIEKLKKKMFGLKYLSNYNKTRCLEANSKTINEVHDKFRKEFIDYSSKESEKKSIKDHGIQEFGKAYLNSIDKSKYNLN